MHHQEVISGLNKIREHLSHQTRGSKTPTALDFVIEELNLYAIDTNSDAKVLLATNRRLNGQEMFAWEPTQVAYGAIDSIAEKVRDEFRGTGAPASERNARFIILVKEVFTHLALDPGYNPR